MRIKQEAASCRNSIFDTLHRITEGCGGVGMCGQHAYNDVAPTFNEDDAVRAGFPDARDGIQVQVSDGWVAIAALQWRPRA